MRSNLVRERWANDQAAISAWLATGSAYGAEVSGMTGVDCVTVDLQHGMIDLGTTISILQAISATPATPFVRVPSNDPATIMKALDAGSYGIICPLVNSASEAESLVAASSYPPIGTRSYGPARGLLYGGPDYSEQANETIVRLAMIETSQGLDSVEKICAVQGLDGIFVGPNDLSLSLRKSSNPDPGNPEVQSAIAHCLGVAKSAGKRAGIFCASGSVARRRAQEGFHFVTVGNEASLLRQATESELSAYRGEA